MTSPNIALNLSLLACLVSACGGGASPAPTAPTSPQVVETTTPPAAPVPIVADATFVGAGDIARCGSAEPEATASLLDRIEGTVFTLGDHVYPKTTTSQLAQCYEPTWGRHKGRTLAIAGNHDWEEASGAAYFTYFGASAGPAGLGYYSTTVGSWHVIALNSNIPAGRGSAQYEWLKNDLTANTATCTLAMWHHPVFSSGENGNSSQMRDAWRLLQQYRTSIALTGHDHDYERFAPQDADGHATPEGIRQFVVGTGGGSLYDAIKPQANSEAAEHRTWGVLKLTLKSDSYTWQFVPIDGQRFSDSGSARCVVPSGM